MTDARGDVDADVAFSDEVAVVFAIEASVTTDPAGLDLVGKVKLQGEANQKGKRDTLAKGTFAGQFGVDGDGEAALSGIDKDGDTVSRGDILIGGEPIDIELTDDGSTPVLPPAIVLSETNPTLKVKAFRRVQLGGS